MDPIGDGPPTSPYGVVREVQQAQDAGMLRLIEGAAQGLAAALAARNSAPAAPIQLPPEPGSTVHVVA